MRPTGSVVSLFVDLVAEVVAGDVIETRTGRRYHVIDSRRARKAAKHAGRQYLDAIVMHEDDPAPPPPSTTHRIRWYKRGRSPHGGVRPTR